MSEHHHGPPSGQGAVLIDIGAGVGAVVLAMPARLDGAEIDIVAVDDPAAAPRHVGVVVRPTPDGPAPSAVFDGVTPGRYSFALRPDGPLVLDVAVRDSEVAFADWPEQ